MVRVLMVVASDGPHDPPSVWAQRQIDSLTPLGIEAQTYLFRNRRSIRGLILGALDLRRYAQTMKADLVHVHYGAAQALAAVLCSRKPVIVSFCGSDLLGNYDTHGTKTWSGRLSNLLSQLAALGCRRLITKSEELKDALWMRSVQKKCDVIPNGVDLDLFRPLPQRQARKVLGWSHDDPVVLFMDRKGDWVKDPDLAHAAYLEVKARVPALRMHVVENEPADTMPLYYNAADALLLTSRHEGSNNTLKEAMACNLPVVSTKCGDAPERLRFVRCCFVCDRDSRQLAARLTEVVMARQRSNGRHFIQQLGMGDVAIRIKRCYETANGKPAVERRAAEGAALRDNYRGFASERTSSKRTRLDVRT